ncbi:MAG: VOC family protein, partial [Geminicoccaceae bacterium]|nr:VOC family protein [Geminicoccaceae bacterium]
RPNSRALIQMTGMRSIGGLDHVIVLVQDLGRAVKAWGRLGFNPTPEALHSAAMGTANTTIVFADQTYIELLAVRDETPLSAGFVAQLREREGPFGIACKTGDAGASAEEFEAAGVGQGGAIDFARPVELPGGVRDAAFSIARLAPSATPGSSMFVCQHHTPDVVWRPEHLEQPNEATGLREVIGVASDLEPLAQAYRRLFGERLEATRDGLAVATGTATLRFLTPLAFADRFGQIARSGDAHLAALVLATADLRRCREVLEGQGVTVARSVRDTLLIPPDAASETTLEFVQA